LWLRVKVRLVAAVAYRPLSLIIPAKAKDYVFTGNGKVPRGKSKPKFVFGYDRWPGVEVTVQKRRKPGIFTF